MVASAFASSLRAASARTLEALAAGSGAAFAAVLAAGSSACPFRAAGDCAAHAPGALGLLRSVTFGGTHAAGIGACLSITDGGCTILYVLESVLGRRAGR